MTQLCNSCDKLTYIVMTNFIYCYHLITKMGQPVMEQLFARIFFVFLCADYFP